MIQYCRYSPLSNRRMTRGRDRFVGRWNVLNTEKKNVSRQRDTASWKVFTAFRKDLDEYSSALCLFDRYERRLKVCVCTRATFTLGFMRNKCFIPSLYRERYAWNIYLSWSNYYSYSFMEILIFCKQTSFTQANYVSFTFKSNLFTVTGLQKI